MVTNIEGTRVYGPVRETGAPPISSQVTSEFLNILVAVRKPLPEWMKSHNFPSTPELEERIVHVLDAASEQVPGINRESLDKIIRHDPWDYPEWPVVLRQGIRNWSFVLDLPQLAANWDNDIYREEREIAERDYEVGEKELDFLQAVFEQIPAPASIYPSYSIR